MPNSSNSNHCLYSTSNMFFQHFTDNVFLVFRGAKITIYICQFNFRNCSRNILMSLEISGVSESTILYIFINQQSPLGITCSIYTEVKIVWSRKQTDTKLDYHVCNRIIIDGWYLSYRASFITCCHDICLTSWNI